MAIVGLLCCSVGSYFFASSFTYLRDGRQGVHTGVLLLQIGVMLAYQRTDFAMPNTPNSPS